MGVTDLRPYFTQTMGHNSVNVHQIPTKVGTEICLNEPFKCAKFQLVCVDYRGAIQFLPDQSTHSCFVVDFVKYAK